MKKIKLEVGKTYRSRDGEEVKIVKKGRGVELPYQGNNGEWYTESGRWDDFSVANPEDLIEEVTTSDANQKHNEMEVLILQVGKTYVNRRGEEVRIVGRDNRHARPYRGSNGGGYAENGKWGFLSDEHPEDLVEEVLVLQIGKTYRNRKGELVGIVGKNSAGRPPFKGSDGEWYTENGKWQYFGAEHPEDLVEEVPETRPTFAIVPEALTATRYTFTIPEGVKKVIASQEGNRIIVEMVPEKGPKPGDVMVNDRGSVYIFKEVMGNNNHEHYAWLGEDGRLSIGTWCDPGRPATAEEAQPLWDALKKAGKKWNPETMEVEDVPEIKEPKPGDVLVNNRGSVYIFKEVLDYNTHRDFVWFGKSGRLITGGACYAGRPATPEEAQRLFDALKKAGKKWNPETMEVEEITEKEKIEKFLEGYANGVKWSRKQLRWLIEDYLKHKEGNK